jgi:hypothetical protein
VSDTTITNIQNIGSKTITVFSDESTQIVNSCGDSVVYVYEKGPKGDTGPQGPPGYSGAGEPFFVVVSGSLYATTASISLYNINSDILPTASSSFNIGNISYPWNDIYLKKSLFIIGKEIIKGISQDQQTFMITSASITASSVNNYGVFSIGDFNFLPEPIPGAIIKSGSDFFLGI